MDGFIGFVTGFWVGLLVMLFIVCFCYTPTMEKGMHDVIKARGGYRIVSQEVYKVVTDETLVRLEDV